MSVRSLAQELGVSATAVSLALQNSPRVSSTLRERVQRLAIRRGHVPNARLAALMTEVRRGARPGYQGTIGVVALFPEERPWMERAAYAHLGVVLKGAEERAHAHGYKLEPFWVKRPGLTADRLRAILEARGIRGLLCLGSLDPDEHFPAALKKFAVVTQAASIPDRLHRVVSHFTADARLLFDELLQRGYTRPGLIIRYSADRRTDYLYSGGFLSEQERKFPARPVPILRTEEWDEAQFTAWFARHQPDAVVLHMPDTYLASMMATLERQKIRTPRQLGVALLDKNPDRETYSGICQDHARVGAVAAEMLIGRIMLSDFGPPALPKIELVSGVWNEGKTLRARRRTG